MVKILSNNKLLSFDNTNIYNKNNINFSNDNVNLKSNKQAEVMCFIKPNLEYDGISINNNLKNKKSSFYCGQNSSFGYYDESIDGKYINDNDCEGEEELKLCRIDNECDNSFLCYNYFMSKIDIYIFSSSMFNNNIYENFINILDKRGNIRSIHYPINNFNIDEFCDNLYNKIINRDRKCIFFGWSFGTLICNILNNKFINNRLLKKMLLISNTCDGNVSNEAIDIFKNIYNNNNNNNDLIYKLLFPSNYIVTNSVKNKINTNKYSLKIQNEISKAIGIFLSKSNKLCKNNNNVIIKIIHGNKDIVYPLQNNPHTIVIKNAGHGILLQKPDIIDNWLKKNL